MRLHQCHFVLTATAIVLLASACTPRAVHKPDGMLAPTERLLVKRAPSSQPLELVTNDSPAGDAFLHSPSLPIDPKDPDLPHLRARMQAAVDAEKGVGIAAPQVGIAAGMTNWCGRSCRTAPSWPTSWPSAVRVSHPQPFPRSSAEAQHQKRRPAGHVEQHCDPDAGQAQAKDQPQA